jgi:hypothetical protein
MNCIPPQPGFLEGLRELCDQHGAVLIFDEVMTGFRVALGGAQELLRRDARSHHPRQGHRRRHAGRRLRRQARDHVPDLAAGAGLPGRHPVRQSGGDGGRAWRPWSWSTTPWCSQLARNWLAMRSVARSSMRPVSVMSGTLEQPMPWSIQRTT